MWTVFIHSAWTRPKGASTHGRAARTSTAGAGADQSGRKRTSGRVQQSGDGSPQPGRIHAQLHLYLSQRRARQVTEEHDRQPRPRQTHLARTWRKYRALRSPVRSDQRNSRCAGSDRRLRSITNFGVAPQTFRIIRAMRKRPSTLALSVVALSLSAASPSVPGADVFTSLAVS